MKNVCRKCGKEMKPNEKFCPSCGAKVETEETVQAGSSVTDAAPNIVGTYLKKEVPGKNRSNCNSRCGFCRYSCFCFKFWKRKSKGRRLYFGS